MDVTLGSIGDASPCENALQSFDAPAADEDEEEAQQAELLFYPSDIARSYFRGWFSIDLVSCLPVNYVILLMNNDNGETGRSNKFIRLLRLVRIVKLLRLLRVGRLLKKYRKEFREVLHYLKLGKLALQVALLSHWLACS